MSIGKSNRPAARSVFAVVALAVFMTNLDLWIVNVAFEDIRPVLPRQLAGPRVLGAQRLRRHARRPAGRGGPGRRPLRPPAHLPDRHRGVHPGLAGLCPRAHAGRADRRPRRPGGRGRAAAAVVAGAAAGRRAGRATGCGRPGPGPRSAAWPRPPGRCSAACSSRRAGAGSSWSTCRSALVGHGGRPPHPAARRRRTRAPRCPTRWPRCWWCCAVGSLVAGLLQGPTWGWTSAGTLTLLGARRAGLGGRRPPLPDPAGAAGRAGAGAGARVRPGQRRAVRVQHRLRDHAGVQRPVVPADLGLRTAAHRPGDGARPGPGAADHDRLPASGRAGRARRRWPPSAACCSPPGSPGAPWWPTRSRRTSCDLLPAMVVGGIGVGLALGTLMAAGTTSLPSASARNGFGAAERLAAGGLRGRRRRAGHHPDRLAAAGRGRGLPARPGGWRPGSASAAAVGAALLHAGQRPVPERRAGAGRGDVMTVAAGVAQFDRSWFSWVGAHGGLVASHLARAPPSRRGPASRCRCARRPCTSCARSTSGWSSSPPSRSRRPGRAR